MRENNLALAATALGGQPVAKAVPAQPEPINIKDQPAKPPIRYREDSGLGPGFYLKDIQRMLHPFDFKAFLEDVPVMGELDGEPVVYMLDYVRWVLNEEER